MEPALVGNPNISRRDITRKITGQGVYTYDINPSHLGLSPLYNSMLYMGLVTSPYPHAKIVSIDTSKAEAAGYVVLTAKDLPPYSYWSTNGRARGPLTSDEVLYPGQPVVAVAAPTTDQVEDAIDLINVQYEPLPWVNDQQAAMQPDAVQLWPGGNSPAGGYQAETGPIPASIHVEAGDVNSAFQNADVTLGPLRLDTQLEQHYEFEPYGVVAQWTGAQNLTVHVSSEWADLDKAIIAGYFGLPASNVIVTTALGGVEGGAVLGMALGDKIGQEHIAITIAMSKKAGLPVKFGPTRMNQAQVMTHRFPIRGYISLAAKNNGTLTGFKIQLFINVGAYGGSEGADTVSDFVNLYNVNNYVVDVFPANTNSYHVASAMRDVGESQGHYIMETAVDMLAQQMNIDPTQFRLTNMRSGMHPIDPTNGFPYSGYGMPNAFTKAMNTFGWASKWQGWGKVNLNGTTLTGWGLALMNSQKGSLSPPISGQIQVNPNGTITAFTGLTDHGAGGNTTLAILAAESVGLTDPSLANVTMVQSDTSLTTPTGVTAGSRSTRVGGMAFIAAAKDLGRQWFPIIAAKLAPGTQASNLAFGNGTIYDTTNPSNSMAFKDAAALLSAPLKGFGTYTPPAGVSYRVGGVKFFEVQIDTETAQVHVTNYTSSMDIGKVVFAKGAESQSRGGFFMGLGETLFTDRWIDPTTGQDMNPNFHDFRIPTIMEMPDQINTVWEEY
ncbi:MAG: xanthine dehydrogenase family protein molybdopterin-binding subunit, partial [Thaumarchaeota archaeon]|nr:xanthine dehydrogenase family protein molybdopterin-binding subunit [Nitrososphaerota archaeon]